MPQQLARASCEERWRSGSDLHRRRGVVPGGGQGRARARPWRRRGGPGRRQALARRQSRQLVFAYRHRGSRRGLLERVARTRRRRRIRKAGLTTFNMRTIQTRSTPREPERPALVRFEGGPWLNQRGTVRFSLLPLNNINVALSGET